MQKQRHRSLNAQKYTSGPVMYWMSRDQRVHDNWALLYALEQAHEHQSEFRVVFCLRETFPHNTKRTIEFMLSGLEEVEKELSRFGIQLDFIIGDPTVAIPKYCHDNKAGLLVTDFNPLRWHRAWVEKIAQGSDIPVVQVDAHNIVPVWEASPKQEFGAYTLRPKILAQLPSFLIPFPKLQKQTQTNELQPVDWKHIRSSIQTDSSVAPVDWIQPGEKAALRALEYFLENGLPKYALERNDPTKHAQSELSPYLHFGHLSAQTIALAVADVRGNQASKEAFLEELIVRKELSDNYCFYNQNYATPDGFPNWAKETHQKHAQDAREYLYTQTDLEYAKTHDPLWNAAQNEMITRGKMHGYMRMYWAKKIFEWTKNVAEAQETAIYLNDRYFLDGRDPNGYTGIAWSMGGVHDRAWFERTIFGKIRYMNYNGAKSKFDVKKYCDMFSSKV